MSKYEAWIVVLLRIFMLTIFPTVTRKRGKWYIKREILKSIITTELIDISIPLLRQNLKHGP